MELDGENSVAIAISGGGHRASAWGLGVMQAVLDAGLGSSITSVTSVSGGSITNAVVANSVDLTTADRAEFDDATSDFRAVIADTGLFFPGPKTDGYVRRFFALLCLVAGAFVGTIAAAVAAGRGEPWWWLFAGAFALGGAIVLALKGGAAGFGRIGSPALWLLALAITTGLAAAGGAWSTNSGTGWAQVVVIAVWLCVALALGWLAIRMLSRRGQVVVKALDDSFFHGRQLGDVDWPVDHIFATTDLETADSLYVAPRFVASYRRGIAPSAGITLAEAAQASAALPVGFPPATITPTGEFKGSHSSEPLDSTAIPVSDGGSYDNMGDQWDIRRPARMAEWDKAEAMPAGLGDNPNLLIVANSSGAWVWEKWNATSRLGREITSIAKNQGIQYDQTTATRRRVLFDTFSTAIRNGSGLRGVLIQIDRTPFQVVDFLPSAAEVGDDAHQEMKERAAKATKALAELGCTDAACKHTKDSKCAARARWRTTAKSNAGVATTLGPIGRKASDSVMAHARTSTAMYLYVLHGLSNLELLEAPPA